MGHRGHRSHRGNQSLSRGGVGRGATERSWGNNRPSHFSLPEPELLAPLVQAVLSNPCSQSLERLSSVQSLSCVQLFVTSWTAAHQATLSITNFKSLFKLMSIESVDATQPSRPLSIPSPPAFNVSQHQGRFHSELNESFFKSGGQSIGASASASVLPMNIQD